MFLHAGEGLAPERPWLDLLANRFRVIAPLHPGYGNSPLKNGKCRRGEKGCLESVVYPAGDRGFESASLQQRVGKENGFLHRCGAPYR
jgi:pimeloyl-ACP methyl ester carboxylesterase